MNSSTRGAEITAEALSPITVAARVFTTPETPQAARAPHTNTIVRAHAGSGSYRSRRRGTVM